MSELALTRRDWMPLATATLGLFIGARDYGAARCAAGARERRRALNVLLFDLLQLRFDVRISNPRILIDVLQRVAQKKFGNDAINVVQRCELQAIIASAQREIMQADRFKLARSSQRSSAGS